MLQKVVTLIEIYFNIFLSFSLFHATLFQNIFKLKSTSQKGLSIKLRLTYILEYFAQFKFYKVATLFKIFLIKRQNVYFLEEILKHLNF